jgi:hypothetical protein
MSDQIITLPLAIAPPPSAVECRDFPRHYFRQTVVVRFLVKPHFRCGRAILHDISAYGIGLILNRSVPPGTVLFIQLRGRHHWDTSNRLAEVVHCTPRPRGDWLIGCRWTGRLSFGEMCLVVPEPE